MVDGDASSRRRDQLRGESDSESAIFLSVEQSLIGLVVEDQ